MSNLYREALVLLKEYTHFIGKELNNVDRINLQARLEKIIDLFEELVNKVENE